MKHFASVLWEFQERQSLLGIRRALLLRCALLRCALLGCVLAGCVLAGCSSETGEPVAEPPVERHAPEPDEDGNYHVHPGDDLQHVVDHAATLKNKPTIFVHSGTYRPTAIGEAFVRLHAAHDGLVIEAVGDVTLSAQNPELTDASTAPGFPAVVNHVVYFGDGISSQTVLRGFRITGANGFVAKSNSLSEPLEPNASHPALRPGLFFYVDGGAIKIFGRSYPTLEYLEVVDNTTELCGGGISIEHRGFQHESVTIRNSIFRNNRCPATGAAIDVLEGSAAVIENCLFVGNIANTGMDEIARKTGLRYNPQHGCGALTVFPTSRVKVRRCTFTANWNGCDDKGSESEYTDCIFWNNTASDGSRPGGPYELDILDGRGVTGCFLNGETVDLQGSLSAETNELAAPDPEFDSDFATSETFHQAGYRPRTTRPDTPD